MNLERFTMVLAIFDLDETLISVDSDHAWCQFLIDKDLVDVESFQARNDYFYGEYKKGDLDIDAYLRFSCQILTQLPLHQLMDLRREFVQERIKPAVLVKAINLIEKHRALGDCLLVITSTSLFVTEPIIQLLSIPHIIAPEPEFKNNQYTGKIVGTPSFQVGKLIRLNQWLEDKPYDLKSSYFYSDSFNDIPLLEAVGMPVAVDPDAILLQEARMRNWKIISLRD